MEFCMSDIQREFTDNTVALAERFGSSAGFKQLYRDGMALVEEAAQYLDGDGRREARDLPRVAALTYATESMRLTTRLMQMASWLLLQRAIAEGEMTTEEAAVERQRMVMPSASALKATEQLDELPHRLKDLVLRANVVFGRIQTLDAALNGDPVRDAPVENPVNAQLKALQSAFASA
jgi:regulator of CtrA degradation